MTTQRRNKRGQYQYKDCERKARQPKRTAEQEVEYVGMLTLEAIKHNQAFTAKVLGREVARLGRKLLEVKA